MLAIDTDVVVSYLTGDHPIQSTRARDLLEREDIFVPATVLLESEWVLRSVYDFAPVRIAAALRAFCGLPRVAVESPGQTARALDLMQAGMDFADALHLTRAATCEAFISFDRRLAAAARRAGELTVRVP